MTRSLALRLELDTRPRRSGPFSAIALSELRSEIVRGESAAFRGALKERAKLLWSLLARPPDA